MDRTLWLFILLLAGIGVWVSQDGWKVAFLKTVLYLFFAIVFFFVGVFLLGLGF